MERRLKVLPRCAEEIPAIKFSDVIRKSRSYDLEEMLYHQGIKKVTADGRPICVMMTVDDYVALLPVNPNPPRQPEMVRVDGKLFREVI